MLARIKNFFQFSWIVWQTFWMQFRQDACFVWAASLSYTTLLSLVPLLASSLVMLKAFPAFKNFEGQIEQFLVNHFLAGSAEAIQIYLHQFLQKALTLSAMSSLILLVTAVLLIFSMEKAFNHIWKTRSHRRGVSAFLMYWGILTLLPVLIGLGLALVKYIAQLPILQIVEPPHLLFSSFISYSFTWFAFVFLYVGVPNCKVKIRYAFFGGAVSALLFECAKSGFSVYIRYFSSYEVIYGSVAAIPLFLTWLYIAWLIVLFGVEMTHMLQYKTYRRYP